MTFIGGGAKIMNTEHAAREMSINTVYKRITL